jgi:hypothetical protein
MQYRVTFKEIPAFGENDGIGKNDGLGIGFVILKII